MTDRFRGPRRCAVLALGALLLLFQGAAAYTSFSYPYGDKVGIFDARSLAMAGTGAAFGENAFALHANPACLAAVTDFAVISSIALVKVDEDRAFPFHDSFDGFVDYNTYAMNSNVFGSYALGVVKSFPQMRRFPNLALAGYPLYDWNYDYFEEVRDESDQLIGKNIIEHRDGVYALSLGAAEGVTPWLEAGLSINYLKAGGIFERRAIGETLIAQDRQELDADGFNLNLGTVAQVSQRLRLGLVYRSQAKLDGTLEISGIDIANPDSSAKLEYTYPHALVLGVEFRPRNDVTTRLNFDIQFTQWSKFKDENDESVKFDDIWEFAGAVEHEFFIGAPIRFGFRYQPSYQDKAITTTAVSFGTGFQYQGFQIDLGGEIGTRSWRQMDVFPESYYGGTERSEKDRVEESLLRAMVSVGYRI
jgi:hypothetical protein